MNSLDAIHEIDAETARTLLMQMIAHTDRMIYTWSFRDATARALDPERCHLAGLPESFCVAPSALHEHVLPDSMRNAHALFRCGLHGSKSEEKTIHARIPERGSRWLSVRVSTVSKAGPDGIGILSVRDVTEQRRQEAYYQRAVQHNADNRLIAQIQADISADQIEMIDGFNVQSEGNGASYSDIVRNITESYISPSHRIAARHFFARDALLRKAALGETHTDAEFPGVTDIGKRKCWMHIVVQFITDLNDGHIHIYIAVTDVTEERISREHLINSTITDSLTGALNRASFESRVTRHLRDDEQRGCLLFFDVDDFKHYNDTFGHQAGDQILVSMIRLVREHFRDTDLIGRLGGDEYLVFLPNAADGAKIETRVEEMLSEISRLHIDDRAQIQFSVSVGCTYSQPGTDSFAELVKRADSAMYAAKHNGKNSFVFSGADGENDENREQ